MGATAVQTVEVLATEIADLKMIVPRIHRDNRGIFSETYSKAGLNALGVKMELVQDNDSLSVERPGLGDWLADWGGRSNVIRKGQQATAVAGIAELFCMRGNSNGKSVGDGGGRVHRNDAGSDATGAGV